MQTIAAIILAICKAVPALEKILDALLAGRARARETQALRRKQAKDAAVDAAIDAPPPAPGQADFPTPPQTPPK